MATYRELRPLLASSLLHLAMPKERQIAYLKEIGFRKFADDKVPIDELILEFYQAISPVHGDVERGVLSQENYEALLDLDKTLVTLEDDRDLWISRELDSKQWSDIRLLASSMITKLDF